MNAGLFPDECSEALATALALAGVVPKGISDLAALTPEMAADLDLLIVELGEEPMRRIRHISHTAETLGIPILAVIDAAQFPLVEGAAGVTDVIVSPPDAPEIGFRLRRMVNAGSGEGTISYEDLALNTLTYQALLSGVPLDLTFMEYELLRFFIDNQRRVWTREQLLSKVWGYDYFGGARTVDVHVRRLRSKLGEERAAWIHTVRSVGYRFG